MLSSLHFQSKVDALALAKAATSFIKDTSTMCARCDTMDHCTDMCLIVAGVKEARRQINMVN